MTASSVPTHPPRAQVLAWIGPGLLLCALLATAALLLERWQAMASRGLGALTLALVMGAALGHGLPRGLGARCAAGIQLAKGPLLRAGVVLYGLRLTTHDIAQLGWGGVAVDLLVLCSTLALALWLGTRGLGLPRETALLIGAGSSICGAAAVMATEPVLRARAEQVSVAVATVVVFGTLAMLLYPQLHAWNMQAGWIGGGDAGFGLYLGATVHEVGQVIAAGRAIGPEAADAAIVAKMVRVMMLAPVLLALPLLLPRPAGDAGAPRVAPPWFAVGFVVVVLLNSLQLLPAALVRALGLLDAALLATAMAALGLDTHASALRRAGARPLLLALLLFAWLVLGGAAIHGAVQRLAG